MFCSFFSNIFLLSRLSSFFAVTEQNPENVVSPDTTRGMVIDAGSGGSRLHIYRWAPRIFKTVPPGITFPLSDEKWTNRMSPGIADLLGYPDLIYKHLIKLINFAKITLAGSEAHFKDYPIFFKGTGGLREVPLIHREEIMTQVRSILSNKTLCPFYFHHDMARVISGEEEAIFSWAAVNFLMGTLIPATVGTGTADPINQTFGTVDLGGASSQIAFFVPSQDVSEGLFKFQIGGHKHWNVYTKSFLQFGQVSARNRHLTGIADIAVEAIEPGSAVVPSALDYCFFAGYSENVYPSSVNFSKIRVLISGPPVPAQDQFQRCRDAIRPLLVKYNNDYCNVVYNGQCSINGAYQPSVSESYERRFIGTSSYRYPWKILQLRDTSTLNEYRKKAEYICQLSFREVIHYYEVNNFNIVDDKLGEMIPNYCFLVSYTYSLLIEGYGFQPDQSLTVMDQVRGNKVAWALGAILYEINTMPWRLEVVDNSVTIWFTLVFVGLSGIVAGSLITLLLMHESGVCYWPLAQGQRQYNLITDLEEVKQSSEHSSNGFYRCDHDSSEVLIPVSTSSTVESIAVSRDAEKYGSNTSTASTVVWTNEGGNGKHAQHNFKRNNSIDSYSMNLKMSKGSTKANVQTSHNYALSTDSMEGTTSPLQPCVVS